MVQQVYFKVSSVKGVPITYGIKYFRLDIEKSLILISLFFCPFPMKTAEFASALRIVYSWNVPRYKSEVSDTVQRQYNT